VTIVGWLPLITLRTARLAATVLHKDRPELALSA
jgi:hypothetical protein